MISNLKTDIYLNKNRCKGQNAPTKHYLYMHVRNEAYPRGKPGNFKNLNLNLPIELFEWGGGNGVWFTGNDEVSIEKNKYIRQTILELEGVYWKLRAKTSKEPFAKEIVETYKNGFKVRTRKQLMAYLHEYCDNNNLSEETRVTYLINFKASFIKFLQLKYNTTDVYLDEVTTAMYYRFELYMSKANTIKGKSFSVGTIQTYINKLKAMMSYAKRMGEIDVDPGEGYQRTDILKEDKAAKIVTTIEDASFWKVSPGEIQKIETVPVTGGVKGWGDSKELWRTRLLFLFQSWTGFAYSDLDKYRNIKDVIQNDMSGRRCIIYNRSKNGELAIVPLFPQTIEILEALEYNVGTLSSYDTYNNRIKTLMLYYVIKCDSSTHLGRHIFGSRMLTMGFSMEAVSGMMGHTSIKETERTYARIDFNRIYADYDKVKATSITPETRIAI